MRLERNPKLEAQQINDLRSAVGWSVGLFDYAKALERSFRYYGVLEGPQLIGFLNVISDSVTYALIADVMVHPEFQGYGLGQELVQTAIEELKQEGVSRVCVLYDAHLRDFYTRLGFQRLEGGVMRLKP